jgi:hypothetical protein
MVKRERGSKDKIPKARRHQRPMMMFFPLTAALTDVHLHRKLYFF